MAMVGDLMGACCGTVDIWRFGCFCDIKHSLTGFGTVPFFFFFVRASLIFIDQMVVNNNKILYRGTMLNVQSLIHLKPNSRQSPIF